MAQQTRSGTSDVPTGIYTTGPSGMGWRGRTGAMPALVSYEVGLADGTIAGQLLGFGAAYPLAIARGADEGEDAAIDGAAQLRIVPLPTGYNDGLADGADLGRAAGRAEALGFGGARGRDEGEADGRGDLASDALGAGIAIGVSLGYPAGAAAGALDGADAALGQGRGQGLRIGHAEGYGAGEAAGVDEPSGAGFFVGIATGIAGAPPATIPIPVLSNITPDPEEAPGEPGAFSASFRVARLTAIEFDVSNVSGQLAIDVQYADRREGYIARDAEGSFRWPFDLYSAIGDLAVEPVHVSLLPRGGWPPTGITIIVANAKAAA